MRVNTHFCFALIKSQLGLLTDGYRLTVSVAQTPFTVRRTETAAQTTLRRDRARRAAQTNLSCAAHFLTCTCMRQPPPPPFSGRVF